MNVPKKKLKKKKEIIHHTLNIKYDDLENTNMYHQKVQLF